MSVLPDDDDLPLCESTLRLTGHLADGAPQPPEVSGCWPVGTWVFGAAVDNNSCGREPALVPSYAFRVDRDAEGIERYAYLDDPSYPRVLMKVTSGGSGLCIGSFELFSADGTEIWNFKPSLHADQTIQGSGEYYQYRRDQWDTPEQWSEASDEL